MQKTEQDRLNLQHAAITLLLDGRLALAPFEHAPTYVKDVATGTGIWALDYGEYFIQKVLVVC